MIPFVFPSAHPSHLPKQYLDPFIRFFKLTNVTNRQTKTHRQTDHATPSVALDGIWLLLLRDPIITINNHYTSSKLGGSRFPRERQIIAFCGATGVAQMARIVDVCLSRVKCTR